MRFFRRLHPRHMKHPHLLFLWRATTSGIQNVFRNKLLSTATTLIIALMFFVFNIFLALNLATDSVLTSLGKKIDIRVEFQNNLEDYSKRSFIQEMKGLPEVEDVIFVPREEALQRLGSKYPNIVLFLDQNKLPNPLPDVMRVVSKRLESNPKILAFLQQPQYSTILAQSKLKNDVEQNDRQEKIVAITHFLKRIGIWLDLTFAVVVTLIIFNSITLTIYAHRQEIRVMQLVGAKLGFIRGGYLFEGAFYAGIALIISFILARLTVIYMTRHLLSLISDESLLMGLNAILLHFGDLFWLTFFWQFLAATLTGLLSSFLAIEAYLRRETR